MCLHHNDHADNRDYWGHYDHYDHAHVDNHEERMKDEPVKLSAIVIPLHRVERLSVQIVTAGQGCSLNIL